MRGKLVMENASHGGGVNGVGHKSSSGRAASMLPSPTILYVNICRTVMNADPNDPNALDELNDFMPFLRQSLSCLVCAQLIQNPMRPPHNHCQHIVCKKCLGGRMRLKPKCSWCRNQSVFVKDSSLKSLVNCYVLMCEYVNSCLSESLHRASENRRKNVGTLPPAPIPTFTSKDIVDMVMEGVDFLPPEDDVEDVNIDADAVLEIGGHLTDDATEETVGGALITLVEGDLVPESGEEEGEDGGKDDGGRVENGGDKRDNSPHGTDDKIGKTMETTSESVAPLVKIEDASIVKTEPMLESTSSSSSLSERLSTSTMISSSSSSTCGGAPTLSLATVRLSSFDLEDMQSSSDEFHDAMEAVEEAGAGFAENIPVNAAKGVGEDAAKIDVELVANVDDVKERGRVVKQEPAILCTLADAVAEEAFQVVVETENDAGRSPKESPAIPPASASSVHNYSLPPEYDTTTLTAISSVSQPIKRKSSVDLYLPPSYSEPKVSAAAKKIQLVSYPDAAVSIASSGFSTSVSSVEDVITVQDYVPVPTHPSLPHSTHVRRFPPAGKQRAGSKSRNSKKAGCRCGMATQTPGQLTCCGQRCPCYVNGYQCVDCRCRGCRNPYDEHGNKRELSLHDILQRQTCSNTANTTVKAGTTSTDKGYVIGTPSAGNPLTLASSIAEAQATPQRQQLRNHRVANSGSHSVVTVTAIPAFSTFPS